MDKPITLVAFDLGGVLVDVDKTRAATYLGISPLHAEKAFFKNSYFESFVLGKISSDAYFAEASVKLGLNPVVLESAFKEVVQPKIFCNELIRTLQAEFTIWSNINVCHYEHICDRVPVLMTRAPPCGLSFEIGVCKPTSPFFQKCLDNLKVEPSSVLFLDDKKQNILAAQHFGIPARLVRNEMELYQALESANLF